MDLSSCHYHHTCWPRFGRSASKWCHGTVVEALNPHGMVPHPLQTYTRWFPTFICCGWEYGGVFMPLLLTTTLVGPDLGSQLRSVSLVVCTQMMLMPWWSGWGSNPTWNGSHIHSKHIYKVIDNLHMLWMGVWRSYHTVTTKLVGPDLGSQMKLCHLSAHKCCHGTVVIEALNPHGMAPTSTPNIY